MSVLLVAFVALTALLILAVGIAIGCLAYNYGDRQRDVLTSRLMAEQRIEAATRATLRAMRDSAKHYGRGG
jgi:hypothetical protein